MHTQPTKDNQCQWRSYPVRVLHPSSSCCGEPTILVKSMEGGYVTHNCYHCGKKYKLSPEGFLQELHLWVACPKCKQRMLPKLDGHGNYVYQCALCHYDLKLSDLLPWYYEIKKA